MTKADKARGITGSYLYTGLYFQVSIEDILHPNTVSLIVMGKIRL